MAFVEGFCIEDGLVRKKKRRSLNKILAGKSPAWPLGRHTLFCVCVCSILLLPWAAGEREGRADDSVYREYRVNPARYVYIFTVRWSSTRLTEDGDQWWWVCTKDFEEKSKFVICVCVHVNVCALVLTDVFFELTMTVVVFSSLAADNNFIYTTSIPIFTISLPCCSLMEEGNHFL